uniref:Uncharacterized protein n=1 Tax=Catharus ustulatus TaxID=91951 RepID=A0A8C3V0W8_CATUS
MLGSSCPKCGVSGGNTGTPPGPPPGSSGTGRGRERGIPGGWGRSWEPPPGDLGVPGGGSQPLVTPPCPPQTILLQDKEQRLLWGVPILSPPHSPLSPPPAPPAPSPAAPRPERCEGAAAAFRGAPPGPSEPPGTGAGLGTGAVLQKLLWAAQELPRTASAEGSAQLCLLVRACADALGGLQALDPPRGAAQPPPTS